MNYEFKGTNPTGKWELYNGHTIQPLGVAKTIANVNSVFLTHEESICNGHLIAAAPELLEVLTEILRSIENETDPRDIIEYKEDKIRNVIYKALNINR